MVNCKGVHKNTILLKGIKKGNDTDQPVASQEFILDTEIYLIRVAPAVSQCDLR